MANRKTQPKEIQETKKGAAQPKVDVSVNKKGDNTEAERVDMDAQTKRAEDPRPSGLTASEMIRYKELDHKNALTDEEREELTELGIKREQGLPGDQNRAILESTNSEARPATEDEIKREARGVESENRDKKDR